MGQDLVPIVKVGQQGLCAAWAGREGRVLPGGKEPSKRAGAGGAGAALHATLPLSPHNPAPFSLLPSSFV